MLSMMTNPTNIFFENSNELVLVKNATSIGPKQSPELDRIAKLLTDLRDWYGTHYRRPSKNALTWDNAQHVFDSNFNFSHFMREFKQRLYEVVDLSNALEQPFSLSLKKMKQYEYNILGAFLAKSTNIAHLSIKTTEDFIGTNFIYGLRTNPSLKEFSLKNTNTFDREFGELKNFDTVDWMMLFDALKFNKCIESVEILNIPMLSNDLNKLLNFVHFTPSLKRLALINTSLQGKTLAKLLKELLKYSSLEHLDLTGVLSQREFIVAPFLQALTSNTALKSLTLPYCVDFNGRAIQQLGKAVHENSTLLRLRFSSLLDNYDLCFQSHRYFLKNSHFNDTILESLARNQRRMCEQYLSRLSHQLLGTADIGVAQWVKYLSFKDCMNVGRLNYHTLYGVDKKVNEGRLGIEPEPNTLENTRPTKRARYQ